MALLRISERISHRWESAGNDVAGYQVLTFKGLGPIASCYS